MYDLCDQNTRQKVEKMLRKRKGGKHSATFRDKLAFDIQKNTMFDTGGQ